MFAKAEEAAAKAAAEKPKVAFESTWVPTVRGKKMTAKAVVTKY